MSFPVKWPRPSGVGSRLIAILAVALAPAASGCARGPRDLFTYGAGASHRNSANSRDNPSASESIGRIHLSDREDSTRIAAGSMSASGRASNSKPPTEYQEDPFLNASHVAHAGGTAKSRNSTVSANQSAAVNRATAAPVKVPPARTPSAHESGRTVRQVAQNPAAKSQPALASNRPPLRQQQPKPRNKSVAAAPSRDSIDRTLDSLAQTARKNSASATPSARNTARVQRTATVGNQPPLDADHLKHRVEMLNERAGRMADAGDLEESARLTAAANQLIRSHPELFRGAELSPGPIEITAANSIDSGSQPALSSDTGESTVEILPEPPHLPQPQREELASSTRPVVESKPESLEVTTQRASAVQNSGIARVSANGGPQEVGVSPAVAAVSSSAVAQPVPSSSATTAVPRQFRSFVSIADEIEPLDEPRPLQTADAPAAVPAGDDSNRIAVERGGVSESVRNSMADGGADEAAGGHTGTAFLQSPLNTASLAGLLVGISGLIGLSVWRRLERRHFLAAAR